MKVFAARTRREPADEPIDPRARLSRWRRLVAWTKTLLSNVDRSRTFGVAAEMTCWLLLALVPLAAVLGMVVAKLAMTNGEVAGSLLTSLPPATRQLIGGELTKVSAWNGGAVAPLAAATFVWLASSGVHAIYDGLETATESCQRPWWKKRLLALGTCLALSLGVALLTFLGAGVDWALRFTKSAIPIDALHSAFVVVVRVAVGACVAFGLVCFLYWAGLPRPVRRRMPLAPGAATAVALMALFGWGYGFYVSKVGTGSAYQAGLAVVGVTIMTLYLLSCALLLGAEINRVLGARRVLRFQIHPRVAPPPAVTEHMVSCEHEPPPRRRRHSRSGGRSGGRRAHAVSVAGAIALLLVVSGARAQGFVRPVAPPPSDMQPHSPLDLLRDHDDATRVIGPDRTFAVVAGLHLRRVGTTEQVLGPLSPSDTLLSTFPGLLVMGRMAIESGRLSVFGVFGGGAYRTLHWSVPANEQQMLAGPNVPDLWWSGAVCAGAGAELRLATWVTFGAEYDVAQLMAQPGRDLLWPNTADAVKTAVAAVRIAY